MKVRPWSPWSGGVRGRAEILATNLLTNRFKCPLALRGLVKLTKTDVTQTMEAGLFLLWLALAVIVGVAGESEGSGRC
jgi:hypothetical protein